MVPQRRIERRLKPYHGLVIPLYYCGISKLYNILLFISTINTIYVNPFLKRYLIINKKDSDIYCIISLWKGDVFIICIIKSML